MKTESPRSDRAASAGLMISVAGVRGIVGESLTPTVATRFASAFASSLREGPIVLGRDARRSGPMVARAVAAGLTASGRDVIDLGLATTPTTEIAVEHLKAAGGVIITASHNPAPWNALKFLSSRGEFLGPEEGRRVRERYESGHDAWVSFDRLRPCPQRRRGESGLHRRFPSRLQLPDRLARAGLRNGLRLSQ